MLRLIQNDRFWEIEYYSDINEIIVRYGFVDSDRKGRFFISRGFDGDAGFITMEQKIASKIGIGWQEAELVISRRQLLDMRFEYYDYDGKLLR